MWGVAQLQGKLSITIINNGSLLYQHFDSISNAIVFLNSNRNQMLDRLRNSSLLYILKLKQQLRRISLSWLLILAAQMFSVTVLSIQANIHPDNDNHIHVALENIYLNLNSQLATQLFLGTGFFLSLFLIVSFVVFAALKKPINEFDRNTFFLSRLVSASAVMVVCFQFVFIFIMWHYIHTFPSLFSHKKDITAYTLCLCICGLGIIFVDIINNRIRVLGKFTFLFFVFVNTTQTMSIISACLGILFSVYAIKTDEDHDFLLIKYHNIRKIIHLVLLSFFCWKIFDHLTISSSQKQNPYATFIYLGAMMVFTFIVGFLKFICKINRKQAPIIQLCQCLQNLQSNQNDIQSLMIAKQIALECFNRLSKKKQQNIELFELSRKNQKQWKIQDWLLLVNIMIKQQYEKQATMQSGINMIKCRLMVKDQRLFEIIKLLKDLTYRNSHKNISNEYQILKITLKIQQVYFKKHQTTDYPIVHIIRQVDSLISNFYKMCCQQIELIYQFWATVITYKTKLEKKQDQTADNDDETHSRMMSRKSLEAMEELIIKINNRIIKLKEIVSQIQLISSSKRQQKALDYIKFLVTCTYEQQEQFSNKLNYQKEFEDNQAPMFATVTDYSQSLQIMNSKVTQMSLKLASDLHYKKIQVIGENIKLFIPQVYEDDMEKAIFEHHQPVLKIPYLVPLISSDGSVILKSVDSYVQLDCESGFRTSLHFKNTPINKNPILFYNIAKNMIQYYNSAFIKNFKICKKKIDTKIKNKLLNPDQIFRDLQLSDKNIQVKLSQSGFQTQYNCRMHTHYISDRKQGKFQNVRLSLIQKAKGYMILRVMKGHRMKSLIGEEAEPSSKTQSFTSFSLIKTEGVDHQQKQIQQENSQNEEERIACKIENPYQSKINLKKVQLNKSNKFTLKFYAVLFIILSIFLLVIEGFTFVQANKKITNQLAEQSKEKLSSIHQYTSLMLAYQSHYKYALLNMNQQPIQNLGIDFRALIDKSGKDIEHQISLFQNQYLINFKQEQFQKIPYDVKFKYFTIQTDTSTTNLFDFSQNLLLYGNQDSLNFLIRNYQTFRMLVRKSLLDKDKIYNDLFSHIILNYIFSAIVLSFTLVFLALSILFVLKIQQVRTHIEDIFITMNKNNLDFLFKALSSIKNKFFFIGDHSPQSDKMLYKIGENYGQKQKESYNLSKSQIGLNQAQLIIDDTERTVNDSQKLIPNQSFKNMEKQKKQECLGLDRSKYTSLYRYGLILVFLVLVNVLQIVYLKQKVDLQFTILEFKMNNKLISQNMIHQILQAQHYLITLAKNNTAASFIHNSQKSLINSIKLPAEYFSQYSTQYFKKISGNLCDTLRNKNSLSFSYEECKKMGNGILAYGLPKTIEHLNQLLYASTKQGINFWFSKSQGQNYAIFQQIFYSQQIVIAINNENEEDLDQQIKIFEKKLSEMAVQIFALSCLLSFAMLILMLRMKAHIYKSSLIGVGYFLIIPKKVLLQHQVLAHIRQKQILQRIDLI